MSSIRESYTNRLIKLQICRECKSLKQSILSTSTTLSVLKVQTPLCRSCRTFSTTLWTWPITPFLKAIARLWTVLHFTCSLPLAESDLTTVGSTMGRWPSCYKHSLNSKTSNLLSIAKTSWQKIRWRNSSNSSARVFPTICKSWEFLTAASHPRSQQNSSRL